MSRKADPSDLTDAQWARILPHIPLAKPGGRPRRHAERELVNGIRYLMRAGCSWRYLPEGFPPWETVYASFRQWQRDGTWERLHDGLRRQVRVQAGRDPEPSAAILDSQSAKTTEKGGRGALTAASR